MTVQLRSRDEIRAELEKVAFDDTAPKGAKERALERLLDEMDKDRPTGGSR